MRGTVVHQQKTGFC